MLRRVLCFHDARPKLGHAPVQHQLYPSMRRIIARQRCPPKSPSLCQESTCELRGHNATHLNATHLHRGCPRTQRSTTPPRSVSAVLARNVYPEPGFQTGLLQKQSSLVSDKVLKRSVWATKPHMLL